MLPHEGLWRGAGPCTNMAPEHGPCPTAANPGELRGQKRRADGELEKATVSSGFSALAEAPPASWVLSSPVAKDNLDRGGSRHCFANVPSTRCQRCSANEGLRCSAGTGVHTCVILFCCSEKAPTHRHLRLNTASVIFKRSILFPIWCAWTRIIWEDFWI